jgi:hypothetical protein
VQGFVLCGADLLHTKGTYDKASIVVLERENAPFTQQMRRNRESLPTRTIVAHSGRDFAATSSTAIRSFIAKSAAAL